MEEWKDIEGYEGIYQVSNFGLVRTVPGKTTIRMLNGEPQTRHWIGRTLKQKTDRGGYKRVTLWKNRRGKDFLVHRLVCAAFHDNPEDKPSVNHIDGNPANNSASNLEWVTPRENLLHAFDTGLNKSPDQVVLFRPEIGFIKHFRSMAEASAFLGRSHSYVKDIVDRGEKEADGYHIFS